MSAEGVLVVMGFVWFVWLLLTCAGLAVLLVLAAFAAWVVKFISEDDIRRRQA